MEIDGEPGASCNLDLNYGLFNEFTTRQTRSYSVQWKTMIEIITTLKVTRL